MTSSENPRKSTPRCGRRYIRRHGTRQKQIGLSVTSYVNFIYIAHVSYQVMSKSDTTQAQFHVYIVLAHSLLTERLLHCGEVLWRRAASTATTSSARNLKNAFLRQSKNMKITVGVVAKWDAALHGKVWAHTHSFRRSGCGKRSHDKFDTTLITTETTPISLGLLKPKGATYRTSLQ